MRKTLVDKLDEKIITGPECWEWTGGKDRDGYGQLGVYRANGRRGSERAHRLVYELLVGPIPEGLTLDHGCLNKGCVNPEHLEPCTSGENTRRAVPDHCSLGHPLEPSGKQRRCRTCRNTYQRRRYHEAKV